MGDFDSPATREFLDDETERILAAYGNHPSFILLAPSNEPGHYRALRRNGRSPITRWTTAGSTSPEPAGADQSQVYGGAQFATLVRFGGGDLRNSAGWFGDVIATRSTTVHTPVLAHEVGQWCAYPGF